MESTVIRSPPTSRASAARSSVVVITLILDAACAGITPSSRAARAEYFLNIFVRAFRAGISSALLKGTMTDAVWVTERRLMLEGVRSMGAHGKLELVDELIGSAAFSIVVAAQLRADQAELAGHVGKQNAAAGVLKKGVAHEVPAWGDGIQKRVGRKRQRIGGQARTTLRTVEAVAEGPPTP